MLELSQLSLVPDWFVLSQVSTHHLHSSSEDEDIESAFPNELTLQQVSWEHLHYSRETRCSDCLWSILVWSSSLSSAPSLRVQLLWAFPEQFPGLGSTWEQESQSSV